MERNKLEQFNNSEMKERLLTANNLLLDIDQCIFPGPDELTSQIELMASYMNMVPCTSRSFGEMQTETYPGKQTILASSVGVYEGGLVIKDFNKLLPLCDEQDLEKLVGIKDILTRSFKSGDENGFFQSALPDNYINTKGVPFRFAEFPNQLSIVIWPEGTLRSCPDNRDYYQSVYFLDGLKAGRPDLFENISVTTTDGSVLIRPTTPDGKRIKKLQGVQALENLERLELNNCLFIGDDDQMDLEVALYVQQKNGVVIVPENSSREIKQKADFVLPGYAGEAILPFFLQMNLLNYERINSAK